MKDVQWSESVSPPTISTSDNDERPLKEQEYLHNDRFRINTIWRTRLAWWVIAIDSIWLFAILVTLWNSKCLQLSDSVLMVLLGTTTINVLGLAYIVLKGLFNVVECNPRR